ncbi:MAG: hypothetical protein KA735_12590 [Burkholderiaceae bacterium]|nr:hypothetical protein [Burkholderiaceae bacterium]
MALHDKTGGSTIRPAAYCGVVGYKPSFGLINRSGLKPLAESLDTIGIMSRSVADTALLMHTLGDLPTPLNSTNRPPVIGFCRTPLAGC